MEDLANFGKSVSSSISSGFTAATRDIDLQGMHSSLNSMAASTGAEIISFGKELSRDAGEAGAYVAQGAGQAGAYVAQGAGQAGAYVAAGTREISNSVKNLSPERVGAFFMLACTSSVMFSLAFFFLPALPLVPAKFAVCFSVGGACSIGAVGALRGAAAQISHMLAPDRVVVSLAYVGSALATLYASVVMHSYFLTIVASIAQTVALLYYQVSYFPMGAAGLKAVAQMGAHLAKPALYSCGRAMGLVKPKSYLPL